MTHYHTLIRRIGLPPYAITTRERDSDASIECHCDSGEELIYHALIEAGEIDESCPCADCQADRNVRFARWRAEQEKAGVRL